MRPKRVASSQFAHSIDVTEESSSPLRRRSMVIALNATFFYSRHCDLISFNVFCDSYEEMTGASCLGVAGANIVIEISARQFGELP